MSSTQFPDRRLLVAERVANLIEQVPVGGSFEIDRSDVLCDVLEFLVPEILREEHVEWQEESIDGFFFSRAERVGELSVGLLGTCILISDQRVTPFALTIKLTKDLRTEELRVQIGELGGGRLRISGPTVDSRAAEELLGGLNARVGTLEWSYDVRHYYRVI